MHKIDRILITGSTGFIGSHLTRRLIQDQFEVAIIKRKNSDPWRIKDVLDKASFFDIDLRNSQEILNTICYFKPDVIFHLAAYYAVEHVPDKLSAIVDTNYWVP